MFEFSKKTYIMGILNITPDSFSDGGSYGSVREAVERAKAMIGEGADIIDVGGESTRPGYTLLSDQEEIDRISPVITELVKEINVPISIDTYKAAVAREALRLGAHIINDIWGLQREPDIAKAIAEHDAYAVVMHNQDGTEYKGDIIESINDFLKRSIQIAVDAGMDEGKIILDPGIGFGKTSEQNMHVMKRLSEIKALGYPVLLGTSRKSMIGKILDLPPKERVEGTVATTVMGIMQGMDIVRVHDVKENYRAARVTDAIWRGDF